jgi:hypothetical protein
VEQVGDKLGIVERQVRSDLERFKRLVESQGYASGSWRGSINEELDTGTPTTETAYRSQGDSGKAGVSGKAVAGAAAAVAGVAAAAAAVASSSGGQQQGRPAQQPGTVAPAQEVTVVDQPPADAVVRDDVLLPESGAEGYTADSSTEGVEHGVRDDGDDPMIGGGSRR